MRACTPRHATGGWRCIVSSQIPRPIQKLNSVGGRRVIEYSRVFVFVHAVVLILFHKNCDRHYDAGQPNVRRKPFSYCNVARQ